MHAAFPIALSCLLALIAAAPSDLALQNELKSIQDKIALVQKELRSEPNSNLNGFFANPQKRMVAWQPMKRSLDNEREPLLRAIEARLNEILRAGEELGVSRDEVLSDLRLRNQQIGQN